MNFTSWFKLLYFISHERADTKIKLRPTAFNAPDELMLWWLRLNYFALCVLPRAPNIFPSVRVPTIECKFQLLCLSLQHHRVYTVYIAAAPACTCMCGNTWACALACSITTVLLHNILILCRKIVEVYVGCIF